MIKGITLTSSMRSNLLSLKNMATQMSKTQNILSTGKKVNSAIDNAGAYYQARSLTNRASDLNSLLDSMSQGIQTIQTALEGIESATAYLEQMKSIVTQNDEFVEKKMSSHVQLTDNVEELLAQGYIPIDNSVTSQDLIQWLDYAPDDLKLVLVEDVDLDYILRIRPNNVTINGGGHTLTYGFKFSIEGEGCTLENINLNYTGDKETALYVEEGGVTLKNVNLTHASKQTTISSAIKLEKGGNIENLNIKSSAIENLYGIYNASGNLNVKNLTEDLSSQNGDIIGVYGGGDIFVDGLGMNINGKGDIAVFSAGTVSGVYEAEEYESTEHLDGKKNTAKIVEQLGTNGLAAYATTQFYVGNKSGSFRAGEWYLPSMTELLELYGVNYDEMTEGYGTSGATGENIKIVNETLEKLGPIASKFDGWYLSSTEKTNTYVWEVCLDEYGSEYGGYRANLSKLAEDKVRAFWSGKVFDSTTVNKPKVGDIMYIDKTWGSVDDYNPANADKVAGVISGVSNDGTVRVVCLKDLTFKSDYEAGNFDPENPFNNQNGSSDWSSYAWRDYDVVGVDNMDNANIVISNNANKVVFVNKVNKFFAEVEPSLQELEFNKILQQYDKLIEDSSYLGINFLKGDEMSVVFNETRSHKFVIKGMDISSANMGIDEDVWRNLKEIKLLPGKIDDFIGKLRKFANDLGTHFQIIQTRQNFTEALSDVLEIGADKLILADMNEASAEYLMMQTRQQLAVNSLSLASQSARSVLSLF